MLKKIVLNNFRCFKKFQISGLKQLNIIVGDNNSGKTAFLEAVSIVCKPQLKHLFWLVKQRIENPDSISTIKEELDFLFNDVNEKAKIEVESEAFVSQIRIANNAEYGSQKCFSIISVTSISDRSEIEVINNEFLLNKDFSKLNTEIKNFLYDPHPSSSKKITEMKSASSFQTDQSIKETHIFINSVYQLKEKYLIQLLKQLETLKFEDRETWKNDVLPFLQKIYPDLEGVEFGRNSRIIIKTATGALPLSYMGDGFKKAFYLLLAVYCCKDGVLVIDELETGIHYENQLAVWQMLLSASKKFNTQLFISTHSYEMLEYLQKAIENLSPDDKTHWQEQLSLYSFVKLNNKPSSYYYDYSSFDELVKSKWELR